MTVARLSPEFKITSLEIWYDPLEMFRQITKDTDVIKQHVGRLGKYAMLAGEDHTTHLHGMDDAPKPMSHSETETGALATLSWRTIGMAMSETVITEETTERVEGMHGNGAGMGACPFRLNVSGEDHL